MGVHTRIQQGRERAPEAEDGGERDRGGGGQVQHHRTYKSSKAQVCVFLVQEETVDQTDKQKIVLQ